MPIEADVLILLDMITLMDLLQLKAMIFISFNKMILSGTELLFLKNKEIRSLKYQIECSCNQKYFILNSYIKILS